MIYDPTAASTAINDPRPPQRHPYLATLAALATVCGVSGFVMMQPPPTVAFPTEILLLFAVVPLALIGGLFLGALMLYFPGRVRWIAGGLMVGAALQVVVLLTVPLVPDPWEEAMKYCEALEPLLAAYHDEHKRYPTTLEGLNPPRPIPSLVNQPVGRYPGYWVSEDGQRYGFMLGYGMRSGLHYYGNGKWECLLD